MPEAERRLRLEQSLLNNDPSVAESLATIFLKEQLPSEELINLALLCRDRNRNQLALDLLNSVSERSPANIVALFEAAFICRLEGKHLSSARLLLRARSVAPLDMRISTVLMHMLHAAGAHSDADALFHKCAPVSGDWLPTMQAVHEFGRYVQTWTVGAAKLALDRVQAAYNFLSVENVAQIVINALNTKLPFALVRLGDGEGGCVTFGEEEESRFKTLYAQNRRELIAMWFGNDFDPYSFMPMGRRIIETTLPVDIIGIPYESWLTHEYKIASLRGVPSLVNIIRAFEILGDGLTNKPSLCTQQIHMELYNTGWLGRILQRSESTAVVTCLSEIPDLLESRFGVRGIELYRVPGEKGSAAALGAEAVEGTHYPDAFNAMQAKLSRPHNGRLFLIAAGILGKFYATTIRQNGGVALDVGSVVDALARRPTRPGIVV